MIGPLLLAGLIAIGAFAVWSEIQTKRRRDGSDGGDSGAWAGGGTSDGGCDSGSDGGCGDGGGGGD